MAERGNTEMTDTESTTDSRPGTADSDGAVDDGTDGTTARSGDDHTAGLTLNPLALPIRHLLGVVGLIALALVPFAIGPMDRLRMASMFYFLVFIISWDFVSGYTGKVSFGHTFLFGIAGYGTALLNLNYGVDPIIAIPLGVLVGAVGGLAMGLPALRVHGHYFALFTLLPPLILIQLFVLFSDTFGGERGLPNPETIFEMDTFTDTIFVHYYIAFGTFLLALGVALLFTRSDSGLIFTAIKENEEAIAASGINTSKFVLFAFTLSGAIGGLGGAMLVHSPVGSASPSQLVDIHIMLDILIAAIIGGMGTIVGPILGGIFFFWASEWMRDLTIPLLGMEVGQWDLFAFYALTMIILLTLPRGILPWIIERGEAVRSAITGRLSGEQTEEPE